MADAPWHVYVIRCGDGSLYTGITTDVRRRLAEHASGGRRSARFLRGRGPVELVLEHPVGQRGAALRLERYIKRLPRARKEYLVARPEGIEELIGALGEGTEKEGR
jgi:putative endonuclease